MKISRKMKIRIILLLLIIITLMYYLTPLHLSLLQELCTRFFYIPIILGGLWFGYTGGFRVSLSIAIVSIPHAYLTYSYDKALFYDQLLEISLFIIVGPIVGVLKDREQRRTVLNQRLQSLAAIGEAISSVAHEMKNMIIPMRGFILRLREKQSFEGKGALYLDIVEQEAAKLDKMVKDMLIFGRHSPMQREEVELGLLVDDIHQVLDEEFSRNGVKLVCKCDERWKRVPLDRNKVCSALSNLLYNALHASAKGNEVRLLLQTEDHLLRIMVEDEGAGIPVEHLNRIFQPFFTTKSQGTGLGLAITQRIVKEHSGDIKVESRIGGGTRFTLSFPILDHTTEIENIHEEPWP
jgi:two-component system, NtrC family, sensor histidine kinase HydH